MNKPSPRPNISDLHVSGAQDANGDNWVFIANSNSSAWVRHEEFATDERAVKRDLARQHIVLVASRFKALSEQVAELHDFPPSLLAIHPGWTGISFSLPDGEVFTPNGHEAPHVVFRRNLTQCRRSGSHKKWLRLARELTGQSMVMFGIMVSFVAPILELTSTSENFGFEFVGRRGCGKSTAQFLMASVLGGIKNTAAGKYWITFDTTLDGLESAMSDHCGLPMIINEANLFYAELPDRQRATKLKALVFRLAQGHGKQRFKGDRPEVHRFVYVTSSNVSLSRMIGSELSAVADAAFDRLITLEVGLDRTHGIFDSVPNHYENAERFAKSLEDQAHAHHGHAIRTFLEKLVGARASGDKALRETIDRYMDQFRKRARKAGGRRPTVRVMNAFALVYAAGRLAQGFGAIPAGWECGPAVLDCYRQMLKSTATERGFDRLVRDVLALPGVVNLDEGKPDLSDDEFAAVPAFIRSLNKTEFEVMFDKASLDRAIPSWSQLIKAPGVTAIHRSEPGRTTQKRVVRKGSKADRMVCFAIPKGNKERSPQ